MGVGGGMGGNVLRMLSGFISVRGLKFHGKKVTCPAEKEKWTTYESQWTSVESELVTSRYKIQKLNLERNLNSDHRMWRGESCFVVAKVCRFLCDR